MVSVARMWLAVLLAVAPADAARAYSLLSYVGGDYASAFKDNSGVRKFLRYISSPEAGAIWVSTGAVVSPNRQVKTARYPNVLVGAEARQIATAKVVRYDGSDLLPGLLGDDWGAVLQKILQRPVRTNELLAGFQKKAHRQFGS